MNSVNFFNLKISLDAQTSISEQELSKIVQATIDSLNASARSDPALAVIKRIEKSAAPRVLVVVEGGDVEVIFDYGVDAHIFDFDDHQDDPKNQDPFVPQRFRNLAETRKIPVKSN